MRKHNKVEPLFGRLILDENFVKYHPVNQKRVHESVSFRVSHETLSLSRHPVGGSPPSPLPPFTVLPLRLLLSLNVLYRLSRCRGEYNTCDTRKSSTGMWCTLYALARDCKADLHWILTSVPVVGSYQPAGVAPRRGELSEFYESEYSENRI